MKPCLAIIGTAGRDEDGPRLAARGRPFYDAMHREVLGVARTWRVSDAVSGGAAWADHLAVRGFLDGSLASLTLFIPAAFDGRRFVPDRMVVNNPGETLNRYHGAFSRVAGVDSLSEIAEAIRRGARVEVHTGFKRRNLKVAQAASHMVALTFGYIKPPEDLSPDHPGFPSSATAGVKDGGTAHTWREAFRCSVKRHVSLGWLERHAAAQASGDSCVSAA